MSYQYRVLPCPNFSLTDMLIIQKNGFLSFPQFLDNGFKTEGGMNFNNAVRNAKKYSPIFFIANDLKPLDRLEELRKYCANIILPLHKKSDLKKYWNDFEWIGFPNKEKLRDYEINWFIENTIGKKRWWLGIHEFPIKDPRFILAFNGLDSTLPELYAGQYGKIWTNWRESYTAKNKLHWRVIFEMNVQNFRLFLDKLEDDGKQTKLTEFMN